VERFPPSADLPFADAVALQLVRLDPRVRTNQVKDLVEGHDEADVRRALAAVRRERPADVLAMFRKRLGARVGSEPVRERSSVQPLGPIVDEPY
jgi:hypothetical protein